MSTPKVISRQELFDLLWSKPLQEVAAKIGVSDVAVGKACKKVGIPRPPREYWLVPEAQRPERPDIAPDEDRDALIEFQSGDARTDPDGAAGEDAVPVRLQGQVPVSDTLRHPHSLISEAKSSWHKGPDGRSGFTSKGADLRVSASALPRALRLMDALIKACEKLGDGWRREKEFVVACDGVDLPIKLTERSARRDLPKPKSGTDSYWPHYEWVATGELTLTIDKWVSAPCRKEWRDVTSKPLEVRLAEIVNALPRVAAVVRLQDEERAEHQRQSEQRRDRQRQAHEALLLQNERRQRLRQLVEATERAERIRAFCRKARGGALARSEGFAEWISWAEAEAEALDPTNASDSLEIMLEKSKPSPDWWPPVDSHPGYW